MIWIRSLAFMVVFYVMSTIVAIIMTPLLLAPRRWTTATLSVWGKGVTLCLRLICGIKVEVRGRQNLPKGGALIAAKHQCMFDIFGSFAFLPDACFVLKKELMIIPFFGWYAAKGGMIVVDREGHSAALRKLVADAKDRFTAARQLVIFPEGTRKAPGEEPDYKPGIAALYRELEMPVIPLALNTGVHWPAHGFLRHPGTIVFEFLEPIPAGLKRGEFMRELEARIEGASNALVAEGI
ncbi:lysophospholipid acyltransferase family protein [Caulobacter mirabilis]|uniref:1-acyl-sn-glycerol-3-phosphate acyltransferase n=1 Tax=Caulobacter mirabilis TaxID=69666 RepID=A0A2D2B012_9CAUL|nr:lysophospholipid acyltransferase family protein [Caulobacter mirabilis]ATQ43599.1 1-acyl-sn-glycerol-3-phosphate acyltransferase [Caulobacter mirabilis]